VQPSPEEARAAVEHAARAAAPVRSEDRIFAIRLYALAMAVIALSIVIVFLGSLPSWTGPIQGVVAGLAIVGAALLTIDAQRRQHAFSRAGNRLFVAILLFWIVWAEVVWQVSTRSDWLSVGLPRPIRGLHFVLTAVVGIWPLLAGAVIFRLRH